MQLLARERAGGQEMIELVLVCESLAAEGPGQRAGGVVDLDGGLLDTVRAVGGADHLREPGQDHRRVGGAVNAGQAAALADEPGKPGQHLGIGKQLARGAVENTASNWRMAGYSNCSRSLLNTGSKAPVFFAIRVSARLACAAVLW